MVTYRQFMDEVEEQLIWIIQGPNGERMATRSRPRDPVGGLRVIVTGGRDFDDLKLMMETLQDLGMLVHTGVSKGITIVHGAAKGADEQSDLVSQELGYALERHPAVWDQCDWEGFSDLVCTHPPVHYCPAAGPRRNEKMAKRGASLCLAFPGGRGTQDMKTRAKAHDIPVYEVESQFRSGGMIERAQRIEVTGFNDIYRKFA